MGNIRFIMALMVLMLLLNFGVSFSTKTTTLNISTDQSALLQLKAHVVDDPHNFLTTNWSTATSFCNWIGVICGSRHGRVTALDLSNMSLSGTLPPHLGNLSFLSLLNLRNNSFHGSLPVQLANMHRLKYIRLSINNFNGEISSWFGYFPKLEFLSLSFNNFTGRIPSDICDRLPILKVLYLSVNELAGKIPMGLFKCKGLQELELGANSLEGTIPVEIGNLSNLEYLFIPNNELNGLIPTTIGRLRNMQRLSLSENKLEGCIPSELRHLKRLEALGLNENKLGGAIPALLGELVSLQILNLGFNKFSNSIPSTFTSLTNIIYLNLSSNSLSGPLQIGDWNAAVYLDFSANHFSGSIPDTICSPNTSLIYLTLHGNQLEGSLPLSLGNCSELVFLNVAHNNITDTFPHQLGVLPNLRVLILKSNRFHGSVQDSIATYSFPKLQMVDLSHNDFTGLLPTKFFQNHDDDQYTVEVTIKVFKRDSTVTVFAATVLDFSANHFSGSIPDTICAANSSLRYLALNDNQLEGPLPSSLCNCSELEILNVAHNNLTGAFPHRFGMLPNLRVLVLRSNTFHGSIQDYTATSSFSKLQMLDLSYNHFTGLLPIELFQNLKALKQVAEYGRDYGGYLFSVKVTIKGCEREFPIAVRIPIFSSIDLSMNGFDGEIPEAIGELRMLLALNLSHNSLTGPIPPSFGNLTELESLDLSYNKLSGQIPPQLTDLTFLEVLSFCNNSLVGPIPRGKQFETFENNSFSGNLGLCGFPLSKECNDKETPEPAQGKDGNGGIGIIWKAAMMGYGSGVVLGISMGYIVFTTGRPWWLVRMIERDLQNKISSWIQKKRN